jgi:hypothetical protein
MVLEVPRVAGSVRKRCACRGKFRMVLVGPCPDSNSAGLDPDQETITDDDNGSLQLVQTSPASH